MINEKNFSVWAGVYYSFEEAMHDTKTQALYDSDIWIEKEKKKINDLLSNLDKKNFITSSSVSNDYLLAPIVSLLIGQKKFVEIIDFGGGMGMQYLELIAKIPNMNASVKYMIIEGQGIIDNIPESMKAYRNLSFSASLMSCNVDLVHIGSTLQYIDDWKGLLTELISKNAPDYFVFNDLFAGDIPSFVTHQIFYDKLICMRMYNLGEFIAFLNSQGYTLLFKSYFDATILGKKHEVLPSSALPEIYRIKKTVNLIFKKTDI